MTASAVVGSPVDPITSSPGTKLHSSFSGMDKVMYTGRVMNDDAVMSPPDGRSQMS